MKYFNLLLLIPIIGFSQEKFKVEYERRYFTKIEGNSDYHRAMEEQFSKPVYIELKGNNNQCSLKEIERIDNSQGQHYKMQVIGGYKDLESYLDFTTNKEIVSREMEGKLYLVDTEIKPLDWIIARETKKIKGYQVKKATLVKDNMNYEAWFSTEIKSKCGPGEVFGLPGLVLEFTRTVIDKPTSYATFKLENITLDNSVKFLVPTKGKQMSGEEFNQFEEEYNKKMQERIQNISVNKD